MTSELRGPGGPVLLRKDDKAVGRYPTVNDALADLHKLVGYSWHHAFTHEGWHVNEEPEEEDA